jgi:hypothetical protein
MQDECKYLFIKIAVPMCRNQRMLPIPANKFTDLFLLFKDNSVHRTRLTDSVREGFVLGSTSSPLVVL